MKHYQPRSIASVEALSRPERFGVLLLVLGVYLLYFPISQFTSSLPSFSPMTTLDQWLPLWPSWVLIYSFIYLIAFLPVCVTFDRQLFGRVALAYIAVEVLSFVIFILLPVRMTLRPESVEVTSFVTWGLKLCFFLDRPVNCCPSLHVSMAFLGTLCTYKVDRTLGRITGFFALLISVSTLLVKQHFIIDVVLGFLLALTMYRVLVMPFPSPANAGPKQSLGRRWALGIFGLYSLVLGSFYGAYLLHWAPWE